MSLLSSEQTPDLPLEILQAAVHWYVQLNDDMVSAKERRAWEAWLQADIRHRQAWAQMQALKQSLDQIPAAVALPTLGGARQRRRRVVGALMVLLATGGAGVVSYEVAPWRDWMAGYRTRTGERRHVALADGGTLNINTASALDIDYGPRLRLLRLHAGEIMVRTAHDPAARPFEVHTNQGSIRALGTRFMVRAMGKQTLVAVFEGAVAIQPANPEVLPLHLPAGQQAVFSGELIDALQPVDSSLAAWVDGKLVVTEIRLGDFIRDLTRYRPGYLSCDAAVADLRISGVFRLDDTDAVLANLAASMPVRLRYTTPYWVRIEAQ
ncbi:FecR domain-containing protein [Herbaspirillum autotrophicum]|uniref:FecR domain-containing protein n=1 Tax=Herbaspirillum autotrophicum TaxID=180195 RepID=UPI00067C8DD9|nr:FecR domain-containing protein [Herbaspirillum autotrophicum]